MRRWLLILFACQASTTGDEDPPDVEPEDTDASPPPTGTGDTAWVIDTADTDLPPPECEGVGGTFLCGPINFVDVPDGGGDSGDSADSGDSGSGGGGTIACYSITIDFNPNGVAKIDENDETCTEQTTMSVDWACVGPNTIELEGLTTATWTPRTTLYGASLTSAIWPPLTEQNCGH